MPTMARGTSPLLQSPAPSAVAPARVTIGHVQLRDVLICPHEKGVVTYPHDGTIIEHDIYASSAPHRPLAELGFIPNSLSSLTLPDSGDTLLAAGGQEAELYLSLFSPSSQTCGQDGAAPRPRQGFGSKLWESKYTIKHGSINNSVLLTSLSLTGAHQSSAEPRVIVSNNDKTVKFFDIAVRREWEDRAASRLVDAGQLRLDVPVNHSSISPDGRTLLCVGDSSEIYLHRISGGAHITVSPLVTLSLAPYMQSIPYGSMSHSSTISIPASFSSAFSADGSKFAVASQEGVVAVWDVRSTKPLKVIQTDKSRPSRSSTSNLGPMGWLYDNPWDWSRAPGWGARSVKFSPASVGREILTFTEHTSLLHIVDARTFETEEVIRVPDFESTSSQPLAPRPRSISPRSQSRPSAESLPPPPPRIVLFSGALEDTFRIPTSSSRRPRLGHHLRSSDDVNPDDDADGLVVIPPLGDRRIEDDVRRLLGRHGLRARLDRDDHHDGGDGEARPAADDAGEEMDVDELESDCLSSHTPSRASSPAPPAQQPSARPSERLRVSRPGLLMRRESSGPYSTSQRGTGLARRPRRSETGAAAADVDQDLAGTCFDPSGCRVYVASVNGLAEWSVRGAEQRWWIDSAWA